MSFPCGTLTYVLAFLSYPCLRTGCFRHSCVVIMVAGCWLLGALDHSSPLGLVWDATNQPTHSFPYHSKVTKMAC